LVYQQGIIFQNPLTIEQLLFEYFFKYNPLSDSGAIKILSIGLITTGVVGLNLSGGGH